MIKVNELLPNAPKPGISRRDFIKQALAAGLTLSVATSFWDKTAHAVSPKRGGKLRQALHGGSVGDTLDPATIVDSHPISTSWQVRNNLTEISPIGDIIPELAESFEASSDAKTWVFKLRKGVEFHNGKTFEAEDVIYSINYHRSPDTATGGKAAVSGIESIKADGKHTVIFNLKAGNADFPFLMADWHLPIAPAGTKGKDWDKGIGTGPFILTAWDPGVRSVSKRNPNYFKERLPYFDEVETLHLPDMVAQASALLTDQVDAISLVDLKTIDRFSKVPRIRILDAAATRHFTIPMHCDQSPFSNKDLRLSLKYAVDRKELLQKVLRGHGYLGNDHPIGKQQKYFAADLPQRHLDFDKAKYHLKKSGLENVKLQLSVGEVFPGATAMAELFKESVNKIGVDITLIRVPTDGFWSNIWLKKPMCVAFWAGRPTVDWMFTVGYAADSPWNSGKWKNDRFNYLLLKARAEMDQEKRREMYFEMQSICRDDAGTIIPLFSNIVMGVSDKLGIPDQISGSFAMDGLRNHERWWYI
ncbi:MAG TPA: ABC transporter substrate-binding protein [Desulfatiglandales bacterium]|nr:ABC transporter substrate-binding protein [Desulfatiglandales bacterium]